MSTPTVEFLWWPECPSWERALADLREALDSAGLDPGALVMREVSSQEDAERERFPGSPTIRVDGADVDPAGAGEPAALTCRVYRREDGRVSPLPDPGSVRLALTASAQR